ncbi:hypothetical protein NODU109028_18550 [Nocardioides dubius]
MATGLRDGFGFGFAGRVSGEASTASGVEIAVCGRSDCGFGSPLGMVTASVVPTATVAATPATATPWVLASTNSLVRSSRSSTPPLAARAPLPAR